MRSGSSSAQSPWASQAIGLTRPRRALIVRGPPARPLARRGQRQLRSGGGSSRHGPWRAWSSKSAANASSALMITRTDPSGCAQAPRRVAQRRRASAGGGRAAGAGARLRARRRRRRARPGRAGTARTGARSRRPSSGRAASTSATGQASADSSVIVPGAEARAVGGEVLARERPARRSPPGASQVPA